MFTDAWKFQKLLASMDVQKTLSKINPTSTVHLTRYAWAQAFPRIVHGGFDGRSINKIHLSTSKIQRNWDELVCKTTLNNLIIHRILLDHIRLEPTSLLFKFSFQPASTYSYVSICCYVTIKKYSGLPPWCHSLLFTTVSLQRRKWVGSSRSTNSAPVISCCA